MPTKTHRGRADATPTGSNGNGTSRPMSIATPRPKVRLPELGIGVVVIVVFALGAAVVHLGSVERTPVLAAATLIERGETITAADLRVAYLSSDTPVAHLADTQMSEVVGRVALVDMPSGSLLTPGVVAETATLADGDAVAGLSLEPGQYPATGLAVGDRVNVVHGGDTAGAGEPAIARGAVVFDIEPLSTDRKLVSIMASEADAEAIAARAGSGGLRLVLVSP